MELYNIHTHIFTIKCTPNNFLGKVSTKFLTTPIINKLLIKLLSAALPGERDFLQKLGNFVAIGSKKSQEKILEDLMSNYDDNCRFVALTLDMDHMGAGRAEINYNTQLTEIVRLKLKYMHQLLPYVSVDPRRGSPQELLELVRTYVEKYGFIGIKLYPALGFYPYDPNLYEVYKYAEDNALPLMTHCTKGGVFYKGDRLTARQLWSPDLTGAMLPENDHRKDGAMKVKDFKNHFTDPENYRQVLKHFPKLKVCIAHYGGSTEILRSRGAGPKKKQVNPLGNFYEKTKQLISEENNIFTDVSYTLADKHVFPDLQNDINDSRIGGKLLFGTDYFMTIQEKGERALVKDFRDFLHPDEFQKIANSNVKNYLTSNFFVV